MGLDGCVFPDTGSKRDPGEYAVVCRDRQAGAEATADGRAQGAAGGMLPSKPACYDPHPQCTFSDGDTAASVKAPTLEEARTYFEALLSQLGDLPRSPTVSEIVDGTAPEPGSEGGESPQTADESKWTIALSDDNGYEYEGVVTLGKPTRATDANVGVCSVDTSTAAEIPGTMTVTNRTKSFDAKAGMRLMCPGGSPNAIVSDGESKDDDTNGAVWYSTEPLPPGGKVGQKIWLVIPNY